MEYALNTYKKFEGQFSIDANDQTGFTNYKYDFWTEDAKGTFTVYVRPSHIQAAPHPMLSCQPRPRR